MLNSISRRLIGISLCAAGLLGASTCDAAVELRYVDAVLDQHYVQPSGGTQADGIPGFFGGVFPGANPAHFPIALSDPMLGGLDAVVLGSDPAPSGAIGPPNPKFVSLPNGSYLTLGFQGRQVVDQAGADIFIVETGWEGDQAKLYLSADGVNFTQVSILTVTGGAPPGPLAPDVALGNFTIFQVDIGALGFTSGVKAIKLEGVDFAGASPGFDLVNLSAYTDISQQVAPPNGTTPEPATMAIWSLAGMVATSFYRRRLRAKASRL